MKPRGPLMIEHRLIEKMFNVVDRECGAITGAGKVDPVFIDTTVDFIRTYADRTHHGKEEDILFRDLAKMPLSEKDKRGMEELVEEHRYARKTRSSSPTPSDTSRASSWMICSRSSGSSTAR